MPKLIPRRKVLEVLNIHYQTLNNMVKRKEIEHIKIGKNRFYNLEKYLQEKGLITTENNMKICYCRVSSNKQKNDLIRQKEYMKEKYPEHEIISDIGSGLNFNRKGLLKIIDYAVKGKVNEIVIAYKDRLARIGYELIENIIKIYSNGKITIINKNKDETPLEELTKDIITIMNVYTAKINGLRKYKTEMKKIIDKIKSE
jgi:predicted site-specific integrase-resolvase